MATGRKSRKSKGNASIEVTSTRSGGVDIDAESVNIGGDVVGRDKIVYTGVQRDKNLLILLEKVRTFWVEGVLENSVHHAALIELGKQVQTEAVKVDHPWETVVRTTDQPDRTLPPDQKIVDIFDEMGRALLILGEPGSGKTTMLLELARDLIACAKRDSALPIPVVFNLSSWAEKRQTVVEWLITELKVKYGVPSKMGRRWVENNDLTLLLDGLDEVKAEHHRACVDAINEFRLEHGLTGIVVCSRTREYEELANRLKLNAAVLIQPLTREQIGRYITAGGPKLAALGNVIQTDVALQELAQSPLMLSITSIAYSGLSVDDLVSKWGDSTQRRKRLFDAYVDKMFARTARTQHEPYPRRDTVRWLAWLAQQMSEHGQTVFLIERMQPSWLQARAQRRLFSKGSMLVGVLVGGLGVGLFFGLVSGLAVGLVTGLGFGLAFWRLAGSRRDIEPAESLKWSWSKARAPLAGGLVFGLVAGLVAELGGASGAGLGAGLVSGLAFGLLIGLAFGLYNGLGFEQTETKTIPNQGIWQSGKNALLVGLLGGLVFGLVVGLVVELGSGAGLVFVLAVGLLTGLVGMSISGPGVGLIYGGAAFIQHFTLRFILWCKGYIPRNYARFLDYAAERIFLRKVGGGYIFIHRLLQEYFASLGPEQSTQSA